MVWLGKDSCRSTAQNKNKNSPTDQRSYISHLSLKILTINATFDFKFFSFCKQTAVLFHFRTPAFVYLFLGTFFANPRFMSSPNLFHFRTPSSLGCWRPINENHPPLIVVFTLLDEKKIKKFAQNRIRTRNLKLQHDILWALAKLFVYKTKKIRNLKLH